MIRQFIQSGSDAILSFLYPRLCLSCGDNLSAKNEDLCISCQYKIPKTDYHLRFDNPLTERIVGRFHFQTGAACYLFTKGGHAQALIHALKYEGKKEIATAIGENYGKKLNNSNYYKNIDLIIPVPMHVTKVRVRGYNQAEVFAKGLSISMNIPIFANALLKVRKTSSQTAKNRFSRLENVTEVFQIGKNAALLKHKHILLVDDVLTTGATLEACAIELQRIEGVQISVATIAIAAH
ncbi:MAG: ComF family protein [Saprospiraceae bacterium]